MGIIFSMSPGSQSSPHEAINFLKDHKIVAWGTNIRFKKGKFNPTQSSPLKGYINHESQIKYVVEIVEIIQYPSHHKYPDDSERPDEWKESKWKTFFRFSKITPEKIDPTFFKKHDGKNVKHPIRGYVDVED